MMFCSISVCSGNGASSKTIKGLVLSWTTQAGNITGRAPAERGIEPSRGRAGFRSFSLVVGHQFGHALVDKQNFGQPATGAYALLPSNLLRTLIHTDTRHWLPQGPSWADQPPVDQDSDSRQQCWIQRVVKPPHSLSISLSLSFSQPSSTCFFLDKCLLVFPHSSW